MSKKKQILSLDIEVMELGKLLYELIDKTGYEIEYHKRQEPYKSLKKKTKK